MATSTPETNGHTRRWLVPTLAALLVVFGLLWGFFRPHDDGEITDGAPVPPEPGGREEVGPARNATPPASDDGDPEADHQPIVLDLPDESCSIRGRVVNQSGAPVRGVWIETLINPVFLGGVDAAAIGWDPTWQEEDLTTSAAGTFEYKAGHRCPYKIAATTEDHRRGECRPQRTENGLECVVVVEQAWEIHGIVQTRDGSPVAVTRVSATQTWNAEQWLALVDPESTDAVFNSPPGDTTSLWSYQSRTDARGRFSIGPLTRDDWTVMAEKEGYRRTFVEHDATGLVGGGQIRLVIEPLTCWTVLVLSDGDRTVADAEVYVGPIMGHQSHGFHESRTDAMGVTEVCEVSSFNAQIWVEPRWHTKADVHNREGTDPLAVRVHPAGSVVGTLRASPTERPEGLNLTARNCNRTDGSSCEYSSTTKYEPGRFRFDQVPAGEMDLLIRGPQGDLIERHVVVRAGEATDLGVLSL